MPLIRAWRLFKHVHLDTDLEGKGARLNGGRFNSKGVAVIYASGSLSLAAFETLAHLQSVTLLTSYDFRSLTFPENLISAIEADELPVDWRESPPCKAAQHVGDHWIASSRSAVLRVPSALLPQEMNFLLNPKHPDFKKVTFDRPSLLHFRRE